MKPNKKISELFEQARNEESDISLNDIRLLVESGAKSTLASKPIFHPWSIIKMVNFLKIFFVLSTLGLISVLVIYLDSERIRKNALQDQKKINIISGKKTNSSVSVSLFKNEKKQKISNSNNRKQKIMESEQHNKNIVKINSYGKTFTKVNKLKHQKDEVKNQGYSKNNLTSEKYKQEEPIESLVNKIKSIDEAQSDVQKMNQQLKFHPTLYSENLNMINNFKPTFDLLEFLHPRFSRINSFDTLFMGKIILSSPYKTDSIDSAKIKKQSFRIGVLFNYQSLFHFQSPVQLISNIGGGVYYSYPFYKSFSLKTGIELISYNHTIDTTKKDINSSNGKHFNFYSKEEVLRIPLTVDKTFYNCFAIEGGMIGVLHLWQNNWCGKTFINNRSSKTILPNHYHRYNLGFILAIKFDPDKKHKWELGVNASLLFLPYGSLDKNELFNMNQNGSGFVPYSLELKVAYKLN